MKEEQFRKKYKKTIYSIKPNEEMTNHMINKLEQRQERKRPRKTAYIAASLVLAAGIGLAAPNVWQQTIGSPSPSETAPAGTHASVVIPKIELPKMSSDVDMDMIALIVYQDNVYTQAATTLNAADVAVFRGDKLGRTTGGIDEWSGQDEYIELASNIGETDIYSVKGYDPAFRIMTYTEIDSAGYAELFERINGISVSSGADLFGKLKLEGRIASAQWESFASWNNGLQQHAPLTNDKALVDFVTALQTAKPLAADPLIDQGVYDSMERKFIYLKLEDNTQVELTLFEQDLVRYGHAPVFFEVESDAFQGLWESMN